MLPAKQVFGFNSERITKGLSRSFDLPTTPAQIFGLEIPVTQFKVDRHYIFEAKTDIAAADNCNPDIPGSGTVYILYRNLFTENHELTYWLDDNGNKIETVVYNLQDVAIPSRPRGENSRSRFLCIQDMSGDLWVAWVNRPICKTP